MTPLIFAALPILACAIGVTALATRRGIRVAAGVITFMLSGSLFFAAFAIQKYQANSDFGAAARRMVPACISSLERGATNELMVALREFEAEYQPRYEGRSDFQRLAHRLADRLEP